MLLAMIISGILGGQVISRTGRYKYLLLGGLLVMAVGFFMLSIFGPGTSNRDAIEAMILIGIGLGTTMQTYILIVQNSVSGRDMAVATSTMQLSRSIGSAIGLAILGTILAQGSFAKACFVGRRCDSDSDLRPFTVESSTARDRDRHSSCARRCAAPGFRSGPSDRHRGLRGDAVHP
jgi:MFS family permease